MVMLKLVLVNSGVIERCKKAYASSIVSTLMDELCNMILFGDETARA